MGPAVLWKDDPPTREKGGSYVGFRRLLGLTQTKSGGDESRSEVMWPHSAVQILSLVMLKIGERKCVCICVHT